MNLMELFPSSAQIAQQTWELENNIIPTDAHSTTTKLDPSSDAIFFYDETACPSTSQRSHGPMISTTSSALRSPLLPSSRWSFTLALVAPLRSWSICSKTDGDAIIVMDAFPLLVEGIETWVNAQADAYGRLFPD